MVDIPIVIGSIEDVILIFERKNDRVVWPQCEADIQDLVQGNHDVKTKIDALDAQGLPNEADVNSEPHAGAAQKSTLFSPPAAFNR